MLRHIPPQKLSATIRVQVAPLDECRSSFQSVELSLHSIGMNFSQK